jgi:hypothetical protein
MLSVPSYLTLIREVLLNVMIAVIDAEPHARDMVGAYFTGSLMPNVNRTAWQRFVVPAVEMTVEVITDLGGNVVFVGVDENCRWAEGFLVYDGRKYEWGEQA